LVWASPFFCVCVHKDDYHCICEMALGKSRIEVESEGCAVAICQLQLRELAKTDVPDKQLPATAENWEKWAKRMSLLRYGVGMAKGSWRRIRATV